MSKINKSNNFPIKVPEGAIVGLNYSGMHDTSVAILSPTGLPLYAVSLERVTRVKQDGRSPRKLLEGMPWDKVSKVAISVSQSYDPPKKLNNEYHPTELDTKLYYDRSHGEEFRVQLDFIPKEKIFVPHHIAHAASAFWLSGFSDATCLVYDGGMSNEEWFGGVYDATVEKGVKEDQLFSASSYSNITKIYTAVTALLGFQPLKHEGKITGLAANGKPTKRCRDVLNKWLNEPALLDGLIVWQDMYQDVSVPKLVPIPGVIEALRSEINSFSKEELAATIQVITEEHVVKILEKIQKQKQSKNLCLAGGLFANVKVNQIASETGFEQTFISPPMSDDGTALGAAFHVAELNNDKFSQKPFDSFYLGTKYSANKLDSAIRKSRSRTAKVSNISLEIAQLLNDGAIVAVFDGPMEFGPRALGNRSILAKADTYEINRKLNDLLHRTEFMPFAPICREEDAHLLFDDIDKVWRAAHFMTVTVNCTKKMSQLHPAVVHVDGTARPQLISSKSNKLIHDILNNYKELSGKFALVNTSFNIHEEPIIMSPNDALKGFYEAGIDAILLGNKLIKLSDNPFTELSYVRNKLNDTISSIKHARVEVYDQAVKAFQANERADNAIALANQAETRANNAEAATNQANERADNAIALANQAETRANNAEAATNQANERADNAIALANQAETRANNAEAATNQANERADNAIALANQAETRANNAEAATNQANERADNAIALANQAETRANNAEAATNQANERADNAIALANQAETRANNAEAATNQANERADNAIALANQAETRANNAEAATNQANERADNALIETQAAHGMSLIKHEHLIQDLSNDFVKSLQIRLADKNN